MALGVVLVVTAAALVAAGLSKGYPSAALVVRSGQAWLASSAVGQATLVDGTTGELAEKVPVASAGNQLRLTQLGHDVVVANEKTGAVSWLDAALLEVKAIALGELAGPGTRVVAGPQQVHVVRGSRYIALDPKTRRTTGRTVDLGRQFDLATLTADSEGRLWALDTTGALVRISESPSVVRDGVATVSVSRVTVTGGQVAVVDPARRQATAFDSEGREASQACLPADVAGTVEAVGSSTRGRILVASGSARALIILDLVTGKCSRRIPLTSASRNLGTPVEAGGRVFVPDRGSGQVHVVDIDAERVVASPVVMTGSVASMQLLARDGVVFYNDPASQRAGIVRLDGTRVPVQKYDPAAPGAGIATGVSSRQPTRASNTGTGSTSKGPSGQEPGGSGAQPTGSSSNSSQPTQKSRLKYRLSESPVAGKIIGLQVHATGAVSLESAEWDFADGSERSVGLALTHRWESPGTYQVAVSAVDKSGVTLFGSFSVRVTASGRGDPDAEEPGAGGKGPLGGPTDPTDSTGPSNPVHPVTARVTLRLVVAARSVVTVQPASIEGTSTCESMTCLLTYPQGAALTLGAIDMSGTFFSDWGGTCPAPTSRAGQYTCSFVITRDQTTTVNYTSMPAAAIKGFKVTPNAGTVPLTVTTDATDVGGFPNPVTYRLEWGDGSPEEVGTYRGTHTYTTAGAFTVTLSVIGGDQTSKTASETITALAVAPDCQPAILTLTAPVQGELGKSVSASATATACVTSFAWVVDGPEGRSTLSVTGSTATFVGQTTGTYTITATPSNGSQRGTPTSRTIAVVDNRRNTVTARASVYIVDDELVGSNETGTYSKSGSLELKRGQETGTIFTFSQCVGDEVVVEMHPTVALMTVGGAVRLVGTVFLYEGTSCGQRNLKARGTFDFTTAANSSVTKALTAQSPEGDYARVSITISNKVTG